MSGRGLWRLAVLAARRSSCWPRLRSPPRPTAERSSSLRTASRSRFRLRRRDRASACGSRRTSTRTSTASRTGSRWTSSGRRRRTTGLKVPVIMDASPYYSTLGRGNESERKADIDGDGLQRPLAALLRQLLRPARLRRRAARHGRHEQLDRLPADRRPVRAPSAVAGIDWLNGRRAGLRQGRQPRRRRLAQRQDRHDRQVVRRHARERRRRHGRRRPVDDRADLGDLELVRLHALERDPASTRTTRRASRTRSPTRPTAPVARPSG